MPLKLTLTYGDNLFLLKLANLSNAAVAIWSTSCSWGYASYSFRVFSAGEPDCEIRRKPAIWTANIPVTMTIAAGEDHMERFSLNDGTWDLSRCGGRGAGDISVAMEADADETTTEQEILTGRYESNRLHFAQLREVIHG